MNCERQDELLEALQRGYVGAELDAHVTSCAGCRELRAVAGALLNDRSNAFAEAALPSAGTIWFRMMVRQRQDAAAAARKSLLIGQALTLSVAIALVVSFFGADIAFNVRGLIDTIRVSAPLLFAFALIVLAPVWGLVVLTTGAPRSPSSASGRPHPRKGAAR
jgi:hypothetical protein